MSKLSSYIYLFRIGKYLLNALLALSGLVISTVIIVNSEPV